MSIEITSVVMYIFSRKDGSAQIEVILGEGSDAEAYLNIVDDNEPEDVWGPVLQRALDEALFDYEQEHAGHSFPILNVQSWQDVKTNHDATAVFEVEVREYDDF